MITYDNAAIHACQWTCKATSRTTSNILLQIMQKLWDKDKKGTSSEISQCQSWYCN